MVWDWDGFVDGGWLGGDLCGWIERGWGGGRVEGFDWAKGRWDGGEVSVGGFVVDGALLWDDGFVSGVDAGGLDMRWEHGVGKMPFYGAVLKPGMR